MLLRQITGSDGGTNDNPELQRLVIAEMEAAAPILGFAQFYPMSGNSDSVNAAVHATNIGENRAINADYTPNTLSPTPNSATLTIIGDKVQTDVAYERRGAAIASERRRQLSSAAKSMGRHFTDQLVNGDGTGTNMAGLVTLATGGQAYTLDQGGANGLQVPLGNSDATVTAQQQFVEEFNEALALVNGGADVIIADAMTIARLGSIRQANVTVTTINDAFGRPMRLTMWDGIPLVAAGYGKDNTTKVLPFSETVGTSTDCGSIYAMKWGEKEALTLMTNTGLSVKDYGLVGIHYLTLAELDVNTLLVDAKAVVRVKGFRL